MSFQMPVKSVPSYRSPEARRLVRTVSYALPIPVRELTSFRRLTRWVEVRTLVVKFMSDHRAPLLRSTVWTGSYLLAD